MVSHLVTPCHTLLRLVTPCYTLSHLVTPCNMFTPYPPKGCSSPPALPPPPPAWCAPRQSRPRLWWWSGFRYSQNYFFHPQRGSTRAWFSLFGGGYFETLPEKWGEKCKLKSSRNMRKKWQKPKNCAIFHLPAFSASQPVEPQQAAGVPDVKSDHDLDLSLWCFCWSMPALSFSLGLTDPPDSPSQGSPAWFF